MPWRACGLAGFWRSRDRGVRIVRADAEGAHRIPVPGGPLSMYAGRWLPVLLTTASSLMPVGPDCRSDEVPARGARADAHSFARPDQVRVGHVELYLEVDFG